MGKRGIGLTLMALVIMSGCASEPSRTTNCSEVVQALADKRVSVASTGELKVSLPEADPMAIAGSEEEMRWIPLRVNGAQSVRSPQQVLYAVAKKNGSLSKGGGQCDGRGVFLVVADGGISNTKRAFGPLVAE
jgi:hypothetical protein